jgi:hypothetical protein
MISLPVPPVRRLLASEVGPVLVTTDVEAGIARSDAGHTWTQSPDETPDQLHARAVRMTQIAQDL